MLLDEPYEVKYWSEKFNISETMLKKAVKYLGREGLISKVADKVMVFLKEIKLSRLKIKLEFSIRITCTRPGFKQF
ncbi:MAG: DUF3606 domain-containing protein [Bacteroidota bacterium]|nr:DUF3606 domain-containing protein [Bacteroidota bacterium]